MSRYAPLALCAGLLLAGIGTVAADDVAQQEAVKKDRKKYEGTWQAVSLVVDGNEAAAEDAQKITVVNDADGQWELRSEDKVVARGTSEIDPTKEPKAVDLKVTVGEGAGKTARGIYDLGVDSRTVCLAGPGQERPAEFSSKAGSGHILVMVKRVKT
jgi:uncharacterized protein (TIGR03067 family)